MEYRGNFYLVPVQYSKRTLFEARRFDLVGDRKRGYDKTRDQNSSEGCSAEVHSYGTQDFVKNLEPTSSSRQFSVAGGYFPV
jgi:hypothetical protein